MYKEQLRVNKAQFEHLLVLVSPHVKFKDTLIRACIPADKRLAIYFKWLASGCDLRTLAVYFNVSHSSCVGMSEFAMK